MNPVSDPLGLILLAAAAAALGVLGIGLGLRAAAAWQQQRRVSKELRAVTTADLSVGAQQVLRAAAEAESGWSGAIATRLPRSADVAYVLQQSAVGWTVGQLVTVSVFSASVVLALSLVLVPRALLGVGVPLLTLAALPLPFMYVLWARGRRWRALERQLPDVAGLLARAVRAGHPVSAAIRMVSEEMPAPAADEFRQVAEETRFGLPFDESLLSLVDRIPIIDLRLMVTAMLVQREVGGNLAEILERVAETIRERFRLRKQVSVLTAEARLSGVVLIVLPILTAGVIHLANPDYMKPLFIEPMGRMMLMVMAVMELIGFWWMRRITRVEV